MALVINGVAPHPNHDYFNLARAPLAPYTTSPFYQDSLLLPFLANALHVDHNLWAFLGLCFTLLVGLFVMVTAIGRTGALRFGAGVLLLPALVVHPVSQVLTNWIGSADPITVGLSIALMFLSNPWVLSLAAIVGVFNHPQMLVIALGVAWVRGADPLRPLSGRRRVAFVIAAIVALGVVRWILWETGRGAMQTRLDVIFQHSAGYWLKERLTEAPANLVSLHGALLPALALGLILLWRDARAYCRRVLIYSVAAGMIAFVTWDFTRVFGVLTVAIDLHLLACASRAKLGDDRATRRLRHGLLLLVVCGVVFPRYITWHRTVVAPAIPYLWGRMGGILNW